MNSRGANAALNPGYYENKSKNMISVEQGKERIFGVTDSNVADFDKKGGKKILTRPQVNNIFWAVPDPAAL